ncbi:AraC family transcriptional regulator [uncultured Ruthenibacterium sp.]|uniref:AraC family transcriptional regulator n=1 Tax=uncultured Ruthenibacterium sp. TaxID=1905347 RepID=UPI00349EA7CA
MKIKTYEQLKEYLDRQEREGAVCFHGLDEKTLSKVVVGLDSHQVLTSIPNEEVKTQKFVVRQKTRNYSTPRHRHEYIEFIYVMNGQVTQEIEGRQIVMRPGDLCLLDCNVSHSNQALGEGDWAFNLIMTTDFFDTLFQALLSEENYVFTYIVNSLYSESKDRHYVLHHLPEQSFEAELMRQILCEYYSEDGGNMGRMVSCLSLLFIEISRDLSVDSAEQILQKTKHLRDSVMDYLQKNYRDATLLSTAEHLHFHPNYLSNLIKRETGKGFKDMLTDIRLAEAQRLLRSTDWKIGRIAEQVGYANEGRFYKVFQQKYRISPGEYRREREKS